ncbi:MAG: ATP-dependent zinc metalloprotease FtsH, partial [Lentisphaeria bacterium]|nr:ATP-dependent zinc metalloprotease FtsH [Lentisphaeria bacterium]
MNQNNDPESPKDSLEQDAKVPATASEEKEKDTTAQAEAPKDAREQPSSGNAGAPENDGSSQRENDTPPQFRPQNGAPRPPMARWQVLFWIILIVLLPLCTKFFIGSKNAIDELTQQAFESHLIRGLVSEMVTRDSSSSSVVTVTGTYIPATKHEDGATTLDAPRKFRTKVIYSSELDQLIRKHCKSYSAKSDSNTFSQVLFMLLPTILFIAFFYFIFVKQMRGGDGALKFGKSRARRLDPDAEHPVTFKDVAGCDEAKEDMAEIVDYLKNPEAFSRLGGKIPRGVLLVGPPGTGKTLLAKAIAGEAQVPFFSISGSDFVEMFVGVGAARVRDMFEDGKKNAPCLIFIDEIDAVGRSRFSGIGGGHDEREQTLNALLVEMDGFEQNQGVIIIAATNRPDVLDPALLRPGRFDRQITVDLPDLHGRIAILKVHAKKTRLKDDVDLRIIARGTPSFSGADLANLINEAALLATRRKLDAVGMPELEEARDKVRWGRERRSHKMDDKVRRLTAYHEAGHALVGMCCPDAMPLHKITIIPRGPALGATMTLPKDDSVSVSKRQILDMIAVCFGGRTAEELTMDDISAGASQDIRPAPELASKMVWQRGMANGLGLINYAGREEHIFLGRDITRSDDFSPETAREIDLEIRRIVDEQKQRATDILTEHRDDLEKLAQALLVQETMSAHDVYQLLGWQEPVDENPQAAIDGAPETA